MDKCILRQWLKAGFIANQTFTATEEGTPQGGIISPILANMALDGLERTLVGAFKNQVKMIRYADDFVVTGKTETFLAQQVKPIVENFLISRGLELSKEKTKITHINEGFDFLGQNIRKYKNKLLIKPSKKSIKSLLEKVREVVRNNPHAKPCTMIRKLNPILRGWANYHRHVVSKNIFSKMDKMIWQILWRWAEKRHPNKGRLWLLKTYYEPHLGRQLVFFGKTETKSKIHLFLMNTLPIKRHIKVKQEVNPYDLQYAEYFALRHQKRWEERALGIGITRYLWLRQKGKCANCSELITEETAWHVHHKIPKSEGGKDNRSNLVLFHPNCHRQHHALKKKLLDA